MTIKPSTINIQLFESTGDVYHSIDPNKLLNTPINKRLITLINQYSKTSVHSFNSLYKTLIFNLAKFLQTLPNIETSQSYSTNTITWFEYALLRTTRVMQLRHLCTLPNNTTATKKQTEDYTLWSYTLFSASLLKNIGKIISHFKIQTCNHLGKQCAPWNPLLSTLYPITPYYLISELTLEGPAYFKQLSALIAKTLMPPEGFTWISNHPAALISWLNALNDIDEGENSLAPLLNFWPGYLYYDPNNPLIQEIITYSKKRSYPLNTLWKEINDFYVQLTKNKLLKINLELGQTNKLGKLFIAWLKESINNKKISINQRNSLVHVKKDGLLLVYPDIFKEFCNNSDQYKDWVVVYKQFNHLGLTKKSGGDTVFSKFFYDPDSQPDLSYNIPINKTFKTAITMTPPTNFLSPQKHNPIHPSPIKITKKSLT